MGNIVVRFRLAAMLGIAGSLCTGVTNYRWPPTAVIRSGLPQLRPIGSVPALFCLAVATKLDCVGVSERRERSEFSVFAHTCVGDVVRDRYAWYRTGELTVESILMG